MDLTTNERIFGVLLVVMLVGGLLLSPLGFETRSPEILDTPTVIPLLGFAFAGFILLIASLVVLFSRPRTSAVLGILGSLSLVALSAIDQAGLFAPSPPPFPVTILEIVTAVVAVAVIFFAYRVYADSSPAPG